MPRGGKRENAGRKAGSLTARTRAIAEVAIDEGITPLEVMLKTMRLLAAQDHWVEAADVAKSAAPYLHPKLSSVEHTGRDGDPLVPDRIEIVFVK